MKKFKWIKMTNKERDDLWKLHQAYDKHDWQECARVEFNAEGEYTKRELKEMEKVFACQCGAFATYEEFGEPLNMIRSHWLEDYLERVFTQLMEPHKGAFVRHLKRAPADHNIKDPFGASRASNNMGAILKAYKNFLARRKRRTKGAHK